jgi:hypothetical protein
MKASKEALKRVLYALMEDQHFTCFPINWHRMSDDQLANWEARETVVSLLASIPHEDPKPESEDLLAP